MHPAYRMHHFSIEGFNVNRYQDRLDQGSGNSKILYTHPGVLGLDIEETPTRVEDPTCMSTDHEDIFTKIQGLPKLFCDEDAEGRGAGSPGAADCSGTTALAGADDSLLRVSLNLEEPPSNELSKNGLGAAMLWN